MYGKASSSTSALAINSCICASERADMGNPWKVKNVLENIPRQILVLDDAAQLVADVAGVDHYLVAAHFRRIERQRFQQAFHDGVQAPGADVLGVLVHLGGDGRDL